MLSAWYNKQVNHKPDLAKARVIFRAIRTDVPSVAPAAGICIARAAANPGFSKFEIEAGEAFDLVAAEAASSAHQR